MMPGWQGQLQPIADGIKHEAHELIIPTNADKVVYLLSPVMCWVPALLVWAVVPFGPGLFLTDINIGVLFLFLISGLSV